MSTISKPNTFSPGGTIFASEHNNNYDTIYDDYNGSIVNANIKAAAAIASSKLNLSSITQSITINDVSNSVCVNIDNDGTNHALRIDQDGVLAAGDNAILIFSNAAQVNSELLKINQENASSTADVSYFKNDGTGHAHYIQQFGNLATGKYALYINNDGTPADGAGRCIRLDGCTITSTKNPESDAEAGFIAVNVDGTQYAIPYYALS